MLCSVCTEYPKDAGPRSIPSFRQLSVFAEVSETEIPVRIVNNYDIELFGNVSSCNLAQSNVPCITVSGVITQSDAGGSFNFESGELLLASTTTECKLWGQFNGKGSLNGDRFTINSEVEVTCGTGLFQSSSGKLNMIITGLLPTEDRPSPIYELTLDGRLEN